MRTDVFSRAARLTAATGLALAISSVGLATAAGATAAPAPAPATTPTVAPTTTPTTSPTKSPAKPPLPVAEAVDASIEVITANPYQPGKVGVVKVRVRSTVPTDTYRFTVQVPMELKVFEIPKDDGWDCTVGKQVNCDYTGPATQAPDDVWIAYQFPKAPGEGYVVNAEVKVSEKDPNPHNNVAYETAQIAGERTGTGVVAGRVWNDANRNGVRDAAEKGVAGARVELHFGSEDDAAVVGRATTGADGRYRFTKLAPGQYPVSYAIKIRTPDKSWEFTLPNAVGDDTRDSDVRPDPTDPQRSLLTAGLTVANGKTTVVDAGLLKRTNATGTIAGRVWHDANRNGRQDKGEKGVAGARVVVNIAVGTKSKVISRATTGADGRYTVKRLPIGYGKYGVSVATPGKTWTFTEPGVGTERGDSDFRRVDNDAVFAGWFGKDAIVAIHDRTDVDAGKTTVLDAGLLKASGGSGDSLPTTGASAGGVLGAGALLLGGGVALTVLARRRRPIAA
jgi:hypothetical protein